MDHPPRVRPSCRLQRTTRERGSTFVAGYPGAPLDMAYFLPHLAQADGKPINALSPHQFDGKVWRRWSRHRNGTNPWIEGEDNLTTHMVYVESWLKDEFRKRP